MPKNRICISPLLACYTQKTSCKRICLCIFFPSISSACYMVKMPFSLQSIWSCHIPISPLYSSLPNVFKFSAKADPPLIDKGDPVILLATNNIEPDKAKLYGNPTGKPVVPIYTRPRRVICHAGFRACPFSDICRSTLLRIHPRVNPWSSA